MIKSYLPFLCLLSFLLNGNKCHGTLYETETKLKKNLLANYDKDIIPLTELNKPLFVGISLSLVTIDTLNPNDNTFKGRFFYKLGWTDPRLSWNPTEYGNIKTIFSLKHQDVWTPDVVLYNGEHEISDTTAKGPYTLVGNDGKVLWVPPTQMKLKCSTELGNTTHTYELHGKFFPDHKNETHDLIRWCTFIFGSWVFDVSRLQLTLDKGELDVSSYTPDPKNRWEIVENKAIIGNRTYPCCPDSPYMHATFAIKLRKLFD